MTTFLDASQDEVFGLPAIAEMVSELWKVKQEISKLRFHEAALADILRKHIERTGEPLEVEGIPALKLTPARTTWYDTSSLDGGTWAQLRRANENMVWNSGEMFLEINDRLWKKAKAEQGLDVELTPIHGQSTPRLAFDKQDADPMATAARRRMRDGVKHLRDRQGRDHGALEDRAEGGGGEPVDLAARQHRDGDQGPQGKGLQA